MRGGVLKNEEMNSLSILNNKGIKKWAAVLDELLHSAREFAHFILLSGRENPAVPTHF